MPTKGFPLVPRMVPEETAVQQASSSIEAQMRTESPRVHRRLFDLSVRGSTGAF